MPPYLDEAGVGDRGCGELEFHRVVVPAARHVGLCCLVHKLRLLLLLALLRLLGALGHLQGCSIQLPSAVALDSVSDAAASALRSWLPAGVFNTIAVSRWA